LIRLQSQKNRKWKKIKKNCRGVSLFSHTLYNADKRNSARSPDFHQANGGRSQAASRVAVMERRDFISRCMNGEPQGERTKCYFLA